jgi:hypothetical protein
MGMSRAWAWAWTQSSLFRHAPHVCATPHSGWAFTKWGLVEFPVYLVAQGGRRGVVVNTAALVLVALGDLECAAVVEVECGMGRLAVNFSFAHSE